MMTFAYNKQYPTVDALREKSKSRVPRFAFDYLDGGCNEGVNLAKNTREIREVELIPRYLSNDQGSNIKTELFGHTYDAPFGISPVGLQGLIWPNSPEILASAAFEHNIPFILSTVSTSSIERIETLTEGRAWFQLYRPRDDQLRDKLINRIEHAGCKVLVLTCDVPTFGYRPKDIRNGLAMPPSMTMKNVIQMLLKPKWLLETIRHGRPNFETLTPYMSSDLDMKQLGVFMDETFSGRLNEADIKPIRDRWKGKLVLKGVASEEDAEKAIALGVDGIIVSNHGGRQLDAGESTIKPLTRIAKKYGDQIPVMMDSGIRSGPDIARTLASGAAFTFSGRSFMYGVAALGQNGGVHTVAMLKVQLQQVLEQLCCENIKDLPRHLNAV